jgi:carbamoyl-phosphate synthase large subunit
MKTLLVSGASGVVGYGILRSLRKSPEKYKLIGITIYTDSVAQAFCDMFERALLTKDDNYMEWLCSIIKKHNVDMIIPGIEADMYKWCEKRETISQTGAKILLNNPELIELCADKWVFYNKLRDSNSKYAIESRISGSFDDFSDEYGLPFLLKPRQGFASKGIIKVENRDIFLQNQHSIGSVLMAQPIVGNEDEEFTTSAFFDDKRTLCCYMTLKRKLSREGYTEKAQVVDIKEIGNAIIDLAKIFKPVGPTNFQFRMQDNELKLLEINPRISSATSIRTAFGYNESVMSADYYFNGKMPVQPVISPGTAVRYIEEHIFYDRNNL